MPYINFNLYHYAGNNPMKYLDPDGRVAFKRYNGNKNLPPANSNSSRTEHRDYNADKVIELGDN